MSQMPRFLKSSIVVTLFLSIGGLTVACGVAPEPTPSLHPVYERGEVAMVPPPTPTTPVSPTPAPALLAPDDACVSCHTNQEQLVANAKEEEVKEELSEGEG